MAGQPGINESPDAENAGSAPAAAESAESISPEQFSELLSKAAKADENWEKYLRAVADLDNYRKRATRERSEAMKYANEALFEKLLPVVDNFEAALAAANSPQGDNLESLKQGIQMIYTQLKTVLSDAGVQEIDAMGQPFDPNLHEAVSQQPSTDVPEGNVMHQMRKGYRFQERLLRPAMVVVAKQP